MAAQALVAGRELGPAPASAERARPELEPAPASAERAGPGSALPPAEPELGPARTPCQTVESR